MIEIDTIVREVDRHANDFGVKVYLEFYPKTLQYGIVLYYDNHITRTTITLEEMEKLSEEELRVGLCNYVEYMHDYYFAKEGS